MLQAEMLQADKITQIVEAALLAADGPLTPANLVKLFQPGELDEENASRQVRDALRELTTQAQGRGVELQRVASGYRYQVRQELSEWVSRLWDEKPPRYTRALLETLALVAYRQPLTRGDIEQVRGVSVSQNIMRTLLERDWVRVVGQREAPGRPSLYGTTKAFLDYFNLQSLAELPPLNEIKAILQPAMEVVAAEQPVPTGTGEATAGDSDAADSKKVAEGGLQESGDVAQPTPAAATVAAEAASEPHPAHAEASIQESTQDNTQDNTQDSTQDDSAAAAEPDSAQKPAQESAQVVQLHTAHNAQKPT